MVAYMGRLWGPRQLQVFEMARMRNYLPYAMA